METNKDRVTGLYKRDYFLEKCDGLISEKDAGYYIMSCLDVDNFKVINDQYSMNVGNQVLKYIADCLLEYAIKLHGLTCRFTADRFAFFYPAQYKDSQQIIDLHKAITSPNCIRRNIRIRIGRYYVTDCTLSSEMMFEHAIMAEETLKGRYDIYIAEYDDSMRNKLIREQEIVNDMDQAMKNHEFIPFFQPQYNHATGALLGAEALVRWKKDFTFISPGEFIPIFEKNGFVYEVDKYIWEQVCILLHEWMEEGKNPLPVSVNISRFDLYKEDFFDTICGLVKKYEIPTDMLRLEVTESAFADSPKKILEMVNQLITYGFTVEIDDFGSGYSSLNTLKDVPASILKLDMKFFSKTTNSQRSGNIVESVVRMAKWLGMAVIAEGVEDKEQADFLKSIGCYYIQGYLKETIYRKWQQSMEERSKASYSLYKMVLLPNFSVDEKEGKLMRFPRECKNMSYDECITYYAERYIRVESKQMILDTLKKDELITHFYEGKRNQVIEYQDNYSGEYRWFRLTVDLIERPDDRGIIAYFMFENIDESKKAELNIQTMAETDALTGLLNRKAFEDRLSAKLSERESNTLFAFCVLDMDGFKQVNDTFGHYSGDQILIKAGQTLHSALHECDLVGRLGGDEFIICMCNVPSHDIIRKTVRRIWKLLHYDMGQNVQVTASIGIAVCPEDGTDFTSLYHKADKALYRIKENGKNNYGFYRGDEKN